MSLCESQEAKKEVIDFNKNVTYDLRNDDSFKNLNENFKAIPNTYINTNLLDQNASVKYIILDLNICSLGAKYDRFLAYLDLLREKNFYIVGITIQELWKYSQMLEIPGFNFFHSTRKNTIGGGAGIFICNKLKSNLINKCMISGTLESVSATFITPTGKKIQILSGYHVPDTSSRVSQFEHFDRFSSEMIDQIKKLNSRVPTILCGDFNICLRSHRYKNDFIDLIYASGFYIANTLQSRLTRDGNPSFIDNILTNNTKIISKISTTCDKISDHCNIIIQLNKDFFGEISNGGPEVITFKDFSPNNCEKFREKIEGTSWDHVLNEPDLKTSFDKFYDTLYDKFNSHFVDKKIRTSVKHTPLNEWFSDKLKKQRNKFERLKILAKKDPSVRPRLNRFRNKYFRNIQKEKKNFYKNKLIDCEGDSKKIWSVLNRIWHPGKNKNANIEALKDKDGNLVTDSEGCSEIFNEYYNNFTNVIRDAMPIHPTKNFKEYLGTPPNTSFLLKGVSQNEIVKVLAKMSPKKSVDINGMSVNVLKKCRNELSGVLSVLFSRSLKEGFVPDQMKKSRIVPIFKKNDPTDCSNYRGITMIECVGKVLEKIVAKRLYHYMESNNLLYRNQFGFRRKTGTDHCLIEIINMISKSFNDAEIASILSLDVQKAFDIVDWEILFDKLEFYGITANASAWFRSYFTNRTSQVTVNGITGKNVCLLLRGVCQGSVLGPLLFLIFINDLPNCLSDSKSILFADDNQIYNSDKDIFRLAEKINKEIAHLVAWYSCNRLPIHPLKTALTFFKPTNHADFRIPVDNDGNCTLNIVTDFNFDNTVIDQSKKHPVHVTNTEPTGAGGTNILGIYLDPNLNFKEQVKLAGAKVKSSIYALKKAKDFLPESECIKLFHAFCRSHINYSVPYLSICNIETFNQLKILDRTALRSVFGISMRESISYKYKELNILDLNQLCQTYMGKFLHRIERNDIRAGDFNQVWTKNNTRTNVNLRNAEKFDMPRKIKYQFLKRHPFIAYAVCYNDIPIEIKNIEKVSTFTKALKKFYLTGDARQAMELLDLENILIE